MFHEGFPMVRHEILGGLVQLFKREQSRYWQCSASYRGRQYRKSTEEEDLPQAQQYAEDWYLEIRGKVRAGLVGAEKTFAQSAAQFEKEYEIITEGQRSPKWIEGHRIRLRLHLIPFFGKLGVSQVTPGKVQEYRVHRMTTPVVKKPTAAEAAAEPGEAKALPRPHKRPARSTIHDEIVTLRLVLKTAIRHDWLKHLPDLSPPYKTQGKVEHRPWFSPEEYKKLYEASRAYAHESEDKRYAWDAAQVHDYILFMANTGLRPDEAMPKNLEHRDISIVRDDATGERILHIEVRGKRGVGQCKSMPAAVQYYERLRKRETPESVKARKEAEKNGIKLEPAFPQPNDPVFPGSHIKLFNGILRRTGLKLDREGKKRTAYSLRHTYICMRLTEGANAWQVAANCRTSVEMIEKFYARHIKNALDASQINVLRSRRKLEREAAPNRRQSGRERGPQRKIARRRAQQRDLTKIETQK
jgi:integrase